MPQDSVWRRGLFVDKQVGWVGVQNTPQQRCYHIVEHPYLFVEFQLWHGLIGHALAKVLKEQVAQYLVE